jgi:hypothetical protein
MGKNTQKEDEDSIEMAYPPASRAIIALLDARFDEISGKLSQIIKLLDKEPEVSRKAIMGMNALDFFQQYGHADLAFLYNATGKHGGNWSVRKLYARGTDLRNVGEDSVEKFRKKVDEIIDNQANGS